MKKYLLFLLFYFHSGFLIAQNFAWVNTMGSSGNDIGSSVYCDAFGNVYATGAFSGTVDFDPGIGTTTLSSGGNHDVFITKMDANGNLVWAKGVGSIGLDEGYVIKLDVTGGIYVAGTFKNSVDFDPGLGTYSLTATPGINGDVFLLKLDLNGNFTWARRLGNAGDEWPYSIDTDAIGNVYLVGSFESTVDFDPGIGTYTLTALASFNAFILKLDVSGNFLLAKSLGGNFGGKSRINSIKLDAMGNINMSGSFYGTIDFDPGISTYSMTSVPALFFGDSYDIFILKLDASANFLWAKKVGGVEWDFSNCITLDASGNFYITGAFGGTVDFDPGVSTYTLSSNGGYDIYVLKLDASGNFVWAGSIGAANLDYETGTSITRDAYGNIYVAGFFEDTVDFDQGLSTYTLSAVNADAFLLKLSSSGNFIWAKCVGGSSYDHANSVALANTGEIYVTGTFGATVDFDPGPAVYNQTSLGGIDAYILKLSCESPSTTTISGPTLICEGSSQIYSCSTTANTTGYIWSAFPGTTITAGATTVSVILNSGISSGTVAVAPINLCGSGSTTTLNVIVTPLPVINTQSTNQTALAGSNVQFTVGAQGQALTYQWQENSGSGFVNLNNTAPYSGVNTPTLTLSNVAMNLDNYSYRCVVESAGCQKESVAAILDVYNDVSVKKRNGENIFEIFPNPTGGFIKIQTTQYTNEFTFIISDQTGRKVLNGRVNNRETVIDISTLTNGLYFITLGDQNKPIKLIKE